VSILKMTVNGSPIELDIPESRFLAEVLRYDLGLTGTKIGCNEAECGICTVLVDGQPVDSCIFPAFKAQGHDVLTIEGLARRWAAQRGESTLHTSRSTLHAPRSTLDAPLPSLHPLQRAFIDHGAVQCGFCTPGLIMTAAALLDEKAQSDQPVTDHDIKAALKDTYCRCTGYTSVLNAIQAAAQQMGLNLQSPIPTLHAPRSTLHPPRSTLLAVPCPAPTP
jgi:aerobic-type carbon monoxide dehydrogenase small subunit (CoxS/CutS family)